MADDPTTQQPLQLHTLSGCRLAIGRYPAFTYDGRGGGGPGIAAAHQLCFAPDTLSIPPLNASTTRFLGLPLPPGLSIAIAAERLSGGWDPESGAIALEFRARFRFRACLAGRVVYAPPDLQIACTLSSGTAKGQRHAAVGRVRAADGRTRLVGVARVEPSGDALLDRFLGLPDEALAVLECRIETSA
ncbi:MAG: hypothetical protein ACKO5M_06035 [Vulcanococcus sp.]